MIVADPWYDYLALPIAPIVLFLQFGALFLPRWWQRVGAAAGCFAAILWMERYVRGVDVAPDEGVNIGAGVMALWLGCSYLLAAAAAVREVVRFVVRRFDVFPHEPPAGR